jgi:tetratricopeptide (TPR) repeat protein
MRSAVLFMCLVVLASSPALGQTAATEPQAEVVVEKQKPLKPAEFRAEQLDILFGRLQQAKREAGNSSLIEQKIWSLWTSSDSPTAEVLLRQAEKAMDAGAPAESLSILDRLIGAHPDFAEAWNKRATLYYLMHKDDKALADIARALDLEPRHFGALAGRGMIYQRQKKYTDALDAYREALAINPGLATVKSIIKDIEKIERGI